MEGLSIITHKSKQIVYVNHSIHAKSKEKVMELMEAGLTEYKKNPLNSVITLINVTDVHFDTELMNAFKEGQEKSAPYEKKVAVIGLNPLQKIVYNFITSLHKESQIKAFVTEQEAKEWLVAD